MARLPAGHGSETRFSTSSGQEGGAHSIIDFPRDGGDHYGKQGQRNEGRKEAGETEPQGETKGEEEQEELNVGSGSLQGPLPFSGLAATMRAVL
jgi:hypothetical protein